MIAVVDYDTGNLRSVANALRRIGAEFTVTSDAGGTVSFPGITPRLALVNGVPVAAQSTLSVPGGTVCVELYY